MAESHHPKTGVKFDVHICIVRTTKFEDSLSSSKAKHNGMMEGYCK
jgi:hypothetical protein